MDLDVRVSCTYPLTTLRVTGEVDLSNADDLVRFVDQAIAVGCTLVEVDLSEVTFIDCHAIGRLLEAKHRVHAASAHLWVHAVSPQVLRMLELTATDATLGLRDRVPATGL
jgi:anti-sigma B factor antagonist